MSMFRTSMCILFESRTAFEISNDEESRMDIGYIYKLPSETCRIKFMNICLSCCPVSSLVMRGCKIAKNLGGFGGMLPGKFLEFKLRCSVFRPTGPDLEIEIWNFGPFNPQETAMPCKYI